MIRTLAGAAIALALLGFACSSSSNAGTSGGGGANGAVTCTGTATSVNALESESSSLGCGSSFSLHGDAGVGADCQTPEDCAPTCCACPAGKKYDEALVVACINGKCADSQTLCCGLNAEVQSESASGTGPCE